MKKVLGLIMVASMVMSLASCASTAQTTTTVTAAPAVTTAAPADTTKAPETSTEPLRVGVVLKTLSSEYWGYVAAGAKQAALDLNVEIDLQGPPNETSFNEQINMIETMISAGEIQALCIAPLQSDSVVTKLENCTIPVLFLDTDAPYDKKVTYIGTSNEDAAYKGGEYIAKLIGEGKKAVIIGGVQGNPTIEARVKGFSDALAANGVELLDTQYADSNEEKALNAMETFMQNFEQIDAVLCCNDSMALAAARAADQAGRNDIVYLGFDGISAGVQSVIDGNVTATVAQSPYNMGYQAVANAVKAINGESVDIRIDTGAEIIDSTNAAKYLDSLNKMLGK